MASKINTLSITALALNLLAAGCDPDEGRFDIDDERNAQSCLEPSVTGTGSGNRWWREFASDDALDSLTIELENGTTHAMTSQWGKWTHGESVDTPAGTRMRLHASGPSGQGSTGWFSYLEGEPSAEACASCVEPRFDYATANEWWREFTTSQGFDEVRLEVQGGATYDLEYRWSKWVLGDVRTPAGTTMRLLASNADGEGVTRWFRYIDEDPSPASCGGGGDGGGGDDGDGGDDGGDPPPPDGGDDQPWIFVLMGQSNMTGSGGLGGSGHLESLPRVTTLVQSTQPDQEVWTEDLIPLHQVWGQHVGLGNTFAKRMSEQESNREIKLVPCGIPGSSIYSYEPGTVIDMNIYGNQFNTGDRNLYEHCVRRTKNAVASGGVVKGVLFHQGETNNSDPQWDDRVISLIQSFRAESNIPGDVPFALGELLQEGTSNFTGHNALIPNVVNALPNVAGVSSDGLGQTGDNVHFSADAVMQFGHRYFDRMNALVD